MRGLGRASARRPATSLQLLICPSHIPYVCYAHLCELLIILLYTLLAGQVHNHGDDEHGPSHQKHSGELVYIE
jgi:hypothetical protein